MFKKIVKYILVFIIFIVFFIFSLTLTSLFPSSWIKDNVKESAETLVKEGNRKYYFAFEKLIFLEMDNYSDALMINTAYSIDNKTPMYSAFIARKNFIPNKTQIENRDFVGELKSDSKYERLDQVSELRDVVNGEINESFEYARYWNGYLIILRPLLLIFDYWQIRIFLLIIFAILAIWLLKLISEKISRIVAAIFGFSLLSIEYFYIGLNFMNSITFLIMMISTIVLVKRFEKIKDIYMMFFIVGMLTSFLCLLDVPLVTLGGILILYLILTDLYRDYTLNQKVMNIIKLCFVWGVGYILTWIMKWILIDLIYNRNIIKIGINQVLYRTIGVEIPAILALIKNVIYMLIPLMIVWVVIIIIMLKYFRNINKNSIRKGIPYLVISTIPFVWYIVLSNHSYMHAFFSYRELYLTVVGLLISTYKICLDNKVK